MKLPSIHKSYFPISFWLLTVIKLLLGTFFASHYVTKGFLPFIQYLLTTGNNPYNYFFTHSNVVFPYPAGMLLIISSVLGIGDFFIQHLFSHLSLSLFLFRIPILLADVLIYIVLCNLLPTKENKVLWLYYASPILIYINYFHGQLDVIPTSLLILSLYFLSKREHILSYIMLGIGLATKTHLLIVLPFYAIYLIRQKMSIYKIIMFSVFSILTFILFNIPFFTHSYVATVFNNAEQQRIFYTALPFHYKDLTIFIAPAALLLCLFMFASNKRLNFDSLILTLGLVFTILIALVPPMQGWFYWSIPLFIFFLIKYKDSHLFSFLMMNIFFIAFFTFTKDSDIFESVSATFSAMYNFPNPYRFLEMYGFNALLIQNALFTCLQISVAMNAYWCYRLGIYYNNLYIEKQEPFVIGIGGDSGVGKSTFTDSIKDLVGKRQLVVLNGDDSHKWERQNEKWEYFTHLNPKANYIHKDVNQIYALVGGKTIERAEYNHKTGKFSKPTHIEKNQFIIFQGLHPFFLEKMRDIYNLKIYIEAEEKLRQLWKLERDKNERGHTAQKVKKDMAKRKKDAAKFIAPQKKLADLVVKYYLQKGVVCVKYTFESSIPVDELINELSEIRSLKVTHEFKNIKQQSLTFEGKITSDRVSGIAYKLYPNVTELINNKPNFEKNTQGINQLFLINYLNHFFIANR